MARGVALCVGLNAVDPSHYGGWSGPLRACEFDADDMALLASSRGFEATKLLTAQATLQSVSDWVIEAAARLESGDICLITYRAMVVKSRTSTTTRTTGRTRRGVFSTKK